MVWIWIRIGSVLFIKQQAQSKSENTEKNKCICFSGRMVRVRVHDLLLGVTHPPLHVSPPRHR
jgi:hypothetical protein